MSNDVIVVIIILALINIILMPKANSFARMLFKGDTRRSKAARIIFTALWLIVAPVAVCAIFVLGLFVLLGFRSRKDAGHA